MCDVDRRRFKTTFRAVGDVAALASPDPLALVPQPDSPVLNDAVLSIPAGFNRPGSGERIDTRFARSFPAPF